MNKIPLILFITLFLPPVLFAQQPDSGVNENKNEVKINVFAIALKSVSLQYERKISRKTTVGVTFRVMPNSTLPFKSLFKDLISDSSTANQLDNFKTGNVAITPSIRFYLGHKGAYHGFYLAPFISYAHYTVSLPYKYYDGDYKTIPLSGSMNAATGGFLLGSQWNLSGKVYLDWWILGPHFGFSGGSISGRKSLSPSEQDALQFELDNLDIPLTKTTNTVDANGATVDFSGPWAGIRSGLCVGIRF